MKEHIFDRATEFAKFFNNLESIRICKSDDNNWTKKSIELATDYMPEYIIFKIELDCVQEDDSGKVLTGDIKEVWFWDEEYCPTPVTYPDLSEWTIGARVTVSFDDSDDDSDGEMKKIY